MKNRIIQCLLLLASPVALAGSDFGAVNEDEVIMPSAQPITGQPSAMTQQVGQYDLVWLQSGVKGQSSPIPLIEAVRALAPDVFDILIDSAVDTSAMVHWRSGTITSALKEVASQAGAKYRVSRGSVLVESLHLEPSRPQQRLAWPRFTPSLPVASTSPVIAQKYAAKSQPVLAPAAKQVVIQKTTPSMEVEYDSEVVSISPSATKKPVVVVVTKAGVALQPALQTDIW